MRLSRAWSLRTMLEGLSQEDTQPWMVREGRFLTLWQDQGQEQRGTEPLGTEGSVIQQSLIWVPDMGSVFCRNDGCVGPGPRALSGREKKETLSTA